VCSSDLPGGVLADRSQQGALPRCRVPILGDMRAASACVLSLPLPPHTLRSLRVKARLLYMPSSAVWALIWYYLCVSALVTTVTN
jgi:hypothetical protein